MKTEVKTVRFFSVGYTNRMSVGNFGHLIWHNTKSEVTEFIVSDRGANEGAVRISKVQRKF
jgi:hypothetical protein